MHLKIKQLAIAITIAGALLPAKAVAAVSITDENGVVYDIVDVGEKTCKISDINKSKFKDSAADIVIAAAVTDHSTNTPYTDSFTVTDMMAGAFDGCSLIKSIVIEAPISEIPTYSFRDCASLTHVGLPSSVTTIGSNAFAGCSSLPGIELPAGVKTIGSYSFTDCSALKSISIPDRVTSIDNGVFNSCVALAEVRLPSALTKINTVAFKGCSSLKAPDFPTTLTRIDDKAFQDCTSLGHLTLNAGVSISSNCFENAHISAITWPEEPCSLSWRSFLNVSGLTELTIPSYITDVPLGCFSSCTDLTTLILEEGVTNVGSDAFSSCKSLRTLTLPQSLDVINSNAFATCTSLTDFDFPAEMSTIGMRAFEGCKSLSNLVLPAGASIGSQAFASTELETVTWPAKPMGKFESNPLGLQNITEMTFPGWMTTVTNICYGWPKLTSVTLEEGVDSIAVSAFQSCRELRQVSAPASLRKIADRAFLGCTSLTELPLNEGLEKIGNYAFNGCTSVKALVVPSTLREMGGSAWSGCTALETVTICEGVQEVGAYAFSRCTSLSTATLPSTLTSIGAYAFDGCTKLVGPEFPASLTEIGNYAFQSCEAFGPLTLRAGMNIGHSAFASAGVSSITFPEEPCMFGNFVFQRNKLINHIDFPEWMTVIPVGFCAYWNLLTNVKFGNQITEIGEGAFESCAGLHDVEFPPTLRIIGKKSFYSCNSREPKFGEVRLYGDVEVGEEAFSRSTVTAIIFEGCADFGPSPFADITTITEITFPDCLTDIPEGFCDGWTSLTTVTLPANLEYIGRYAFRRCNLLTSINIPATIQWIDTGAFYDSGLTEFTWPDHEIKFGKELLRGTKITSTVIPAWMTEIPAYTYAWCSKLATIEWADRTESIKIGDYAFAGCSSLDEIAMPPVDVTLGTGAYSGCQSAKEILWQTDGHKTTLGPSAFQDCHNLTSVTIPDYLTVIPSDCFSGCTSLTTVDLGKGITSLGERVFYNCGLTDIIWSPGIYEMGYNVFRNTKFTAIEVPATIAELPDGCFMDCLNLKDVTLHEGLTTIGNLAFQNNPMLETMALPSTVTELGMSTFEACVKLNEIALNDGLTRIGSKCFQYCRSLSRIEIPASVNRIENRAFAISGLEHVTSHANDARIDQEAFSSCESLKTFFSDGHILEIGTRAFDGDKALPSVIITEEAGCPEVINSYAFRNCTVLESLPALTSTDIRDFAFQNCTSLTRVTLPQEGKFYTNLSYPYAYLNGTTALQSVVFPYTGPNFKLKELDIQDAPMKALSYSYAYDIVAQGLSREATIAAYEGPAPEGEEAKLYVRRGQKWKYIEAGYGERFDIMEMKEPVINIEGDIYSEFSGESGKNINHYRASLRWEVNLSDLNADGPTDVEVFCDERKIADVSFSQPVLSTDGEEYIVNVTVNGEPKRFEGDFIFPWTDENGNVTYMVQYATVEPVMRFNAHTSKRLDALDFYGYKSWFIMVYDFDSPDLDTEGVPDRYNFSARMKGYSYTELVNNDGLAEGADGLLYHSVERQLPDMDSEACTIPLTMTVPSLDFEGLYTTAQINADTDHLLTPSRPFAESAGRTYSLAYEVEPALMTQQGCKYTSPNLRSYILKKMTAVEVAADGKRTEVGSSMLSDRKPQGTVAILPVYAPAPGKRYQTVTYSDFRGSFGSAVIEIPDAPSLDMQLSLLPTDHMATNLGDHTRSTFDAHMILHPDVSAMGYDNAMPGQAAYKLGMWRAIDMYDRETTAWLRAGASEATDELLHHTGGATHSHDAACEVCAANASVTHDSDNGEIRYRDVFDVEHLKLFNVAYRPRLYIKVPNNMLRGTDKWMIADAMQAASGDALTGIEDLTSPDGAGTATWYDLQGRPVATPLSGNTYIRVDKRGAHKVQYNTTLDL